MIGKLIILRGLPGSGKTTWARTYLMEHIGSVCVNRDSLRPMLHGKRAWSLEDEHITALARDVIIRRLLAEGLTVISDDTNLLQRHVDHLKGLAENEFAEVSLTTFTTPLEECIRRDQARETPVGEEVIRKLAETMEL